ncbi:alpha-1,6-mannosyl-glycoprotein 4-beta-N-acetylglucosaminyltransferase-like isoform X1 [Falco naumanni]|uniref:alpha-1,6-mannosyl-glycoprotein 4-beta-N-acetylglucosaminyltransferase-like isoform X1 n=1 Tax=Falco naumanni TaxID=148594 RepID=UPI001ADE76E9|nr:alpha-1,6-mannosyl-glycoprotein 4-beta-N-acetylglucosaminyltransferase-like isoform X1 [Falco naumanni]XP_040472360.1 alpha-1,6-mannosyl-glycoprotein 4-beta-N-acetylglucosaminyltransferase-like isoform X1 [Falco naumanni]XP_040472361.1 alpha-1,6-mannosyl-glycoprotein 4-beta-N-acetylglucosaminyltransferase-like isoform X1 [Falco naumanni]
MRCSLKRSVTAVLAASFLLLLLLLLHGGSQQEQDHPEVELRGLAPDTILQMLQPEGAQRILRDSDDLSVLHNISYHLLAGSPSPHKKFLAVGLASVRRPRGYYLPATLQSLFKQSTEEELQEMVVVVHLADADPGWNARVAASIAHKFAHQILLGRLLLIHAPHEFYPTLEGLKRNYNDPEERVKFRSKQNVDYAFLLAFAANLSSYYLMIEDDVWCAKSFLTAIRKALASQEGSNWATLEFSKLGYIGKLYRSSDLPRLARFLLLFYQEMPCDWLLVHFRLLLTQKDVIRFKPSLFQHMGLYSSFQGTVNRLEDDEFQADALDLPDNPPAALFTSMSIFENYEPLKAYSTAEGYFWGKDPAAGSVFSVVFQQPARVTRVRVRTGSSERRSDFLHAGVLELGRRHRADGRDCAAYTTVGTFEKGTFERRGLERGMPGPVECVRIRVTRNQSEWLIIQSIDIWTATDT